jgi:hypothetical protein
LAPEQRAASTTVTVTGVLDLHSYPELRDGLLKIAAEAPDGLVADIDRLRIEQDALASVFALVAMRISEWPGTGFALVSRRPEHLRVLDARTVDRFVQVHGDIEAAEHALRRPVRLRAARTFPNADGTSALARAFVRYMCAEWTVPELADDAQLIATELVENVLRHTRSEARMRLELRRGLLSIAVADDEARPAILRERLDLLEAGLGLRMIAQVAKAWGCCGSWSGGKVVWAVLTRHGGPRTGLRGE